MHKKWKSEALLTQGRQDAIHQSRHGNQTELMDDGDEEETLGGDGVGERATKTSVQCFF